MKSGMNSGIKYIDEFRKGDTARQLAQAIRRILLTHHYAADIMLTRANLKEDFIEKINDGTLKANELLNKYCTLLYQRLGSFQEVARRTGLDRRTVKKYLQKNLE